MHRLRPIVLLASAVLTLALLVVGVRTAPVSAQSAALEFAFEGRVTKGPSAGTTLAGNLALTPAEDGTVAGALTLADGTAVPVTGRLAGTNLTVTFDLGNGAFIFGIGRATESGAFKGPFLGPQDGDQGRWVAKPAGAENPEPDPATEVKFNFSGTVDEGPNQGATLAGELALTLKSQGRGGVQPFEGTLTVPDAEPFAVSGLITNDGKSLRIFFRDTPLGLIIGHGEATEDGGFAGGFRAVPSNDKGSWTATPLE
jgi:hypothetical protein